LSFKSAAINAHFREEILTYNFTSLMADVGGLAGMLLGFSILSAYDTTLEQLNKLKAKIHRAK